MKRIEFNKWYPKLRKLLQQHGNNYSFKGNVNYLKTVKTTLETLQCQEDQFADFVIKKQSEINELPEGFLKTKMQDHLDKITVQTHAHFNKLIEKYKWLLQDEAGPRKNFNFSGD